LKRIISFFFLLFAFQLANAQQVTGVWKGKLGKGLFNNIKVELKLIKNGDSLVGTCYYYEGKNVFIRSSVKGYFDATDNSVIWWDDQLIENHAKKGLLGSTQRMETQSNLDFNCPTDGPMRLDGKIGDKRGEKQVDIHFVKDAKHDFNDEWDDVIENYTFGANDPQYIDSVSRIAFTKPAPVAEVVIAKPKVEPTVVVRDTVVQEEIVKADQPIVQLNKPKIDPPIVATPKPKIKIETPNIVLPEVKPLNTQQKFEQRKKEQATELLLTADSVSISFYDNAEIDGDTISIYLNNLLIHQNIGLKDKPFTIKLATKDLQADNELVMVAENLGSIPPNTALLIAYMNGVRYEARLKSTEETSAMIKLRKK
jgi:hypothetical protein